MGRSGAGQALWAAWALALAGGVSVLIAAVLVVRAGTAQSCPRGLPCVPDLPAGATSLAVVGTVLAVVGGTVAAMLAVRQLASDRGQEPGPASG